MSDPGAADLPLVLGGHSFIEQLGNDAPASEEDQRRLVAACLDAGVRWFDTTYQPERAALGKALAALGRRDEAKILAWNFFTEFGPGDPVGGPTYFEPGHIDRILEQLGTTWVDALVLVPMGDLGRDDAQEALAIEWQRKGYVRALGHWVPDPPLRDRIQHEGAFRYALLPFQVRSGIRRVLEAYKRRGFETIATSPFHRGWMLDEMIAAAAKAGIGEAETLRPRIADAMLRDALFHPGVDRVIVAMRKVEWVERNVESVRRGPLNPDERAWLERVRSLRGGRSSWWRRLVFRSRAPGPPPPR